jgi:hypothetical protein
VKSWRWKGKVLDSVTDVCPRSSSTSSSSSSFSTCLLLRTACYGIRTKLLQLHSNRFWLPSFGVSLIQSKTGTILSPYFEFIFIYFVRPFYKRVKKDFSVCKMIFFLLKADTGSQNEPVLKWHQRCFQILSCVHLLVAVTDSTLLWWCDLSPRLILIWPTELSFKLPL